LKVRRKIYFIVGAVLIFINLLVDLADIRYLSARISENNSFNVGYLIGSQLLLLIGIILLRFGFKLHKRIKGLDENDIEKSINDIWKSA